MAHPKTKHKFMFQCVEYDTKSYCNCVSLHFLVYSLILELFECAVVSGLFSVMEPQNPLTNVAPEIHPVVYWCEDTDGGGKECSKSPQTGKRRQ